MEILKIKTERLIIEPVLLEDKSKELAKAIHEADEFEWYFGIKETEERLKELSINEEGFYNIFDSDKNFIGYVGFYKDTEFYNVEIYVLKSFRKNGYAKECLIAMMEEFFSGRVAGTAKYDISKIVSSVRKENIVSQRLLKACGFEENKEMDSCLLFYIEDLDDELGEPIQLAHYHITREKFKTMIF